MLLSRPDGMRIGSVDLALPVFFPSVSSIKTGLPPLDYVRLLSSLGSINKQFLVSAFDLCGAKDEEQKEFERLLSNMRGTGLVVVMDSGNYESFWKSAQSRWTQADYHSTLKQFSCAMAFGFDEQQPPGDYDSHKRLVLDRWRQDQATIVAVPIIPIVHGNPKTLPKLCVDIARESGIQMIAVPERRLGSGIFERTQTITEIRRVLDGLGRYVGLHLLGTGNPISIAIYSLAGADSYDGLEWCQTVVEYESASLFHLSQGDFFRAQSGWGDEEISFLSRVLAHNLEFYSDWMTRLRRAIHTGNGIEFCRTNFPQRIFNQCLSMLGWEERA
jgi:hypothetical protein